MISRASSVLAICIAGLGCGSPTVEVCQPILIWALNVTVRDAATDLFIGSQSTVLAALHGGGVDIVSGFAVGPDSFPISVGSSPGMYDVTVRHAGYSDWTKENILVPASSDGCHPVTQRLQASLQRLP